MNGLPSPSITIHNYFKQVHFHVLQAGVPCSWCHDVDNNSERNTAPQSLMHTMHILFSVSFLSCCRCQKSCSHSTSGSAKVTFFKVESNFKMERFKQLNRHYQTHTHKLFLCSSTLSVSCSRCVDAVAVVQWQKKETEKCVRNILGL